MMKVKASLHIPKIPTDVIIDVPKDHCNRKDWNEYLKEILLEILEDSSSVEYQFL